MAVTKERKLFAVQIILLGILALASSARNAVWQDDMHLWKDTAKKSPNRAGVHYNLGNAYLEEGRKTIIKRLISIGGLW